MKTDLLNGLLALKIVAEKGNFTEAAKVMDVTPSAISHTIKQLEKTLGSVMLNRTTRSISLTELGQQFLNQYKPGLEILLNAVDNLGSFTGKPVGTLRLNMLRDAWHSVIGPVLAGFRKQYPEILLDIYFEENLVDMVSQGFDAGIRPSELAAGDMTAIMISPPFRYVVAGAPAYFKNHVVPKHPKDLLTHDCIHYKFDTDRAYKRWEFEEKGKDFSVETKGILMVNDSLIMVDSAIKGLGLIYSAEDTIKGPVRRGELVLVLEKFAPRSDGYYLYYPNISQVSPKLRAFIDYLKAQRNT
jgi:DNA-binding transcriptional LysR family regulator